MTNVIVICNVEHQITEGSCAFCERDAAQRELAAYKTTDHFELTVRMLEAAATKQKELQAELAAAQQLQRATQADFEQAMKLIDEARATRVPEGMVSEALQIAHNAIHAASKISDPWTALLMVSHALLAAHEQRAGAALATSACQSDAGSAQGGSATEQSPAHPLHAPTLREAYKQGFIDGITAYAWHKDGMQWVGTTGRTRHEAVAKVEKTWNYNPPHALAAEVEAKSHLTTG